MPPRDDKNRMVHSVEHGSSLWELLDGLLKAYIARTKAWSESDNSPVSQAINNLDRKVDQFVMGLKEDFDALNGKFDSLDSATQAVADDIAALKEEIKAANDRADIDLSPLVARADNIEARLRGAAGANPGSDPDVITT
jgi:outer membrane murein-binding lipoprotein Lpp